MPEQPSFDRARTAVLIMDYQVGIVAMYAAGSEAALERSAMLLAAARRAGLLVIHIQIGFREGYPEISHRNRSFGTIKQARRFLLGDGDAEIHPTVRPEPSDVTVVKRRVSAFGDTDLGAILRARDFDTLILLGIATSGVVLSTVRHAADAEYRLIVVKDCCLDRDEEVHRVLMEKVFPRQATVVTSDEIMPVMRLSK